MQGALAGPARVRTLLVQILASIVIVALLLSQVELSEVWRVLGQSRPGWLILALLLRGLALLVHDLRLWQATLPFARTRLPNIIGIGFACGLLNVVLPIRIGDLAVVALLVKESGLKTSEALAAIGIVAFVEALVFGLFVLGVLLAGFRSWELILGAQQTSHALNLVGLGILVALLGIGVVVVLGRRLRRDPAAVAPGRPGPLALLREVFAHLGGTMGRVGFVAIQLALTVVQIALFIATPVIFLPALGIDLPAPWLAGTGVLAVGSLSGILLPTSYGAGPTAASLVVLGAMGVSAEAAMAFALLLWVGASMVPAALGFIPAWVRLEFLRNLGRRSQGVVEDEATSKKAVTGN